MFEIEVTEKLRLREIEMSDGVNVFALINRDRAYLREWLPFIDYTIIVEHTEAFIKNVYTQVGDRLEIVYVINYENEMVGLISYKNIDHTNHKIELGYWLSQNKQGHGIVTNSCKKMIDLALTTMNMNRVYIRCAINNSKSSKIPKRLGFKFEGIERQGEYLNGHYVDLETYSILKSEWLESSFKN